MKRLTTWWRQQLSQIRTINGYYERARRSQPRPQDIERMKRHPQ